MSFFALMRGVEIVYAPKRRKLKDENIKETSSHLLSLDPGRSPKAGGEH
jgi:hypothetical protein